MAVPWRGLLASAALHGALVLVLIVEWPEEPELESLPADEAVVVSFAVPAGNPDSIAKPETPLVEEIQQIQATEEISNIEPEETENIAPEETTAVEPEPEVLPEPEPLPPAPVAPPDVAVLPPPEPIEAAEPKPPEVVQKEPAPEPAKDVEKPGEKKEDAKANAQPPEGGEPEPAVTSSSSNDPKYTDILSAWLKQKLIYPPKAERRGIEGTAVVKLVIDSEGRVLDYRILKSSGHRILDREVEALIERANPMPPVPEAERAPSLEFDIPVNFDIQ